MVPTRAPVTGRSQGPSGFDDCASCCPCASHGRLCGVVAFVASPCAQGDGGAEDVASQRVDDRSTRQSTRNPMRKTVNARSVIASLNSALIKCVQEEDHLRPMTIGCRRAGSLRRCGGSTKGRWWARSVASAGGGDAQFEEWRRTRRRVVDDDVGFGAASDDDDGLSEPFAVASMIGSRGRQDEGAVAGAAGPRRFRHRRGCRVRRRRR